MSTITQKEYQKRAEKLLKKIRQEVKPFADDTPAGKKKRRERAKNDLLYLCKTYLPHYFEDDFEAGHEKIAGGLKNWNKVIQIWGFRGLGKTTVVGTGYALQLVLFKLTRYLPIISDTSDQATLIMLPIKAELEENPRIQQDFGDMKGMEWSEDSFITSGNVKVEAFSWRSFKRGRKHMQYRAKVGICDDLESLDSVKNKDQVDRRYNALMGDVINGLDLKNEWQLVVVTNKLARYDLRELLLENSEVLSILVPAEKQNGRAFHPKSFPKKVLNQIKALIGVVRYNREYLGKIISSEDDDFQEEWFEWIDEPQGPYKYIVMANDPARGMKKSNDTKAWVVLGLTADENHVDVIHAWIRRTTIDSMIRMGFKSYSRFNPHKSVIESNGFQVLLKPIINYMAKDEGLGIGFKSSIKLMENKADKNVRIMRLQNGVEHQFFRFVRGSDMQRLVDQFLNFDSSSKNNEDDGPDAMEMAYRQIKRLMGETGTVEVEVIG